MKSVLRSVRISPKKADLIAGMVRGMPVSKAVSLLRFTDKKGAGIILKVLSSAVSNAVNNFQKSKDDLVLSKIFINKGPTFKRSRNRAKGRVYAILKRTSNINIELSAIEGAASVSTEDISEEVKVSDN